MTCRNDLASGAMVRLGEHSRRVPPGSWPFGRRLEDQVATRFLSLFLDMEAEFNGKKYHVELLGDQALWDGAPIVPKNPPNPLKNDKEFLTEFPYLAEPWPETW